jgi:hypothetical protein
MDAGGTTHGYTDIGGVFKTVDLPGTVFNQGLGINSANTTVGYFALDKAAGQMGQSAYSQSSGVFTSINALLPANQNSQAVGINNSGNIVGFFLPTATTSIGFLDQGGVISTIDPWLHLHSSARHQQSGRNRWLLYRCQRRATWLCRYQRAIQQLRPAGFCEHHH